MPLELDDTENPDQPTEEQLFPPSSQHIRLSDVKQVCFFNYV